MKRRVPFVLAVLAITVAGLATTSPVRAALPTQLTLDPPAASPLSAGSPVILTATISPAYNPWIDFVDARTGKSLGQARAWYPYGKAEVAVALAPGTYDIFARFVTTVDYEGSQSAPVQFVVADTGELPGIPMSLTVGMREFAAGRELRATAYVPGAVQPAGTVEFVDLPTGRVLYSSQVDPAAGKVEMNLGNLPVGGYFLAARYSGDPGHSPSRSAGFGFVITRDTQLDITGVRITPTTFYPLKDGVLDEVVVSGRSKERVTVSISVFNSAGRRVWSKSESVMALSYTLKWNGRTSSGSLLPAGRYKVVHRVTDKSGNSYTKTAVATLGHQRAVWKSASITLYGDQYSDVDSTSFAFALPRVGIFPRGVVLFGNLYDEHASALYAFALPRRAAYGTLQLSVYGLSHDGGGPALMSILGDPDSYVSPNIERYTGTALGWYTVKGRAAGHYVPDERLVLAYVSVWGKDRGYFEVGRIRLTYSYAVMVD